MSSAIASSSRLPTVNTFPPTSLLTLDSLNTFLLPLSDIDAITSCTELLLSGRIADLRLARDAVDSGLARGKKELYRFENEIWQQLHDRNAEPAPGEWDGYSPEEVGEALETVVSGDSEKARVIRCCAVLEETRRMLETFEIFAPPLSDSIPPPVIEKDRIENGEDAGMDLDDPWAEDPDRQELEASPVLEDPWETAGSEHSTSIRSATRENIEPDAPGEDTTEPSIPPITLSTFLSVPLAVSALILASSSSVSALATLFERHPAAVFPYRLAVLEAIPGWVLPGDLMPLLPRLGEHESEQPWPIQQERTLLDRLPDEYRSRSNSAVLPPSRPSLLVAEALTQWYTLRVNALDDLGLLDLQLAWVQCGASLGVPDLDRLGEDLSLLSRLIYDANLASAQQEKWNLSSWRAASEGTIIKAYLGHSSAESIVGDIKRLVMPYLFVLESRAERAGKPEPDLVERLLHKAVLGLPLQLARPVFESSKATLPDTDRLIRNDVIVSRLALACLYGSDQRDVWPTMSAIFECLPVWDVSGGDLDADKDRYHP